MMTQRELFEALAARLRRRAYRRDDLDEFCNYWSWRMRREGRARTLRALAEKFLEAERRRRDRRGV